MALLFNNRRIVLALHLCFPFSTFAQDSLVHNTREDSGGSVDLGHRQSILSIVDILTFQGEKDDKIIAVCADDPKFTHYKDIKELPPHRLAEIKRFFEDYKKNENKVVNVEDFLLAEDAVKAIQNAMDLYAAYIIESLRRLLLQKLISKLQ